MEIAETRELRDETGGREQSLRIILKVSILGMVHRGDDLQQY